MTMRNISEPSRHQAPIATSRGRWDPRSVGSRPHRRLRLRLRFFESVVFINPCELEANLGTKRTTKTRTFRWSKFHGHARPTRRAVSESVRAVFRTSTSNFRISRVRQLLRVRSPSLAQKSDNVRAFPWSKFGGHTRPTRRAVNKKVRSVYRTTFSERKSPLEARRRHPRSKEVTSSTTPFLKAHISLNKGDNKRQAPRRKEATSTSLRPTSSSKNLLTWN